MMNDNKRIKRVNTEQNSLIKKIKVKCFIFYKIINIHAHVQKTLKYNVHDYM